MWKKVFITLTVMIAGVNVLNAQTTRFVHKGDLPNTVTPATGIFEMEVRLFDAVSDGNQIGSVYQASSVNVKNRAYSVELDFGSAAFPGADRFLEVSIRRVGDAAPFNVLSREQILSVPYAIRALDATNLGGVDVSNFVQTNDPRLTDDRDPRPGSGDYIQNSASPQTGASFNISGNGTLGGSLKVGTLINAAVINAETQFNLGGIPVIRAPGTQNLFAGQLAGLSNTTGSNNAFAGSGAGLSNTTGALNAFFGSIAGGNNTSGGTNSFFGALSGTDNSAGSGNSFFGQMSGRKNLTGNTNSFFGRGAGAETTTGTSNAFFGASSGDGNVTGFANTLLGTNAEVSAGDLSFATAIGANSVVSTSNTIVLGRSAGQDTVKIPGTLEISGAYSADTVSAATQYNIGTLRILSAPGPFNLFAGFSAGQSNTTGQQNSFFGQRAGQLNTTGIANSFFGNNAGRSNTEADFNSFFGNSAGQLVTGDTAGANSFFGGGTAINTTTGARNSFFGASAGNENVTGSNNTLIGYNADVGSGDLTFATAIGANAIVSTSNTVVIGRSADQVRIPGLLVVANLGNAGSTELCRNASNQISSCSSSQRYKSDMRSYNRGLEVIRNLRPITFSWKEGGIKDVGFAAEEVNSVEPLLTTTNQDGSIEGVKYAQITTALVNAVNEQQVEIEQLREQIKLQNKQIGFLIKALCLAKPEAEICKE
jgi:hypothetical protein